LKLEIYQMKSQKIWEVKKIVLLVLLRIFKRCNPNSFCHSGV